MAKLWARVLCHVFHVGHVCDVWCNIAQSHSFVFKRFGEVNNVMKCPRYRHCVKIALPLLLLIVIIVMFSVIIPGLDSTSISVAYCANTVVSDQPQRTADYGSHNFRRPNRLITEYDDEVVRRLAYLVERRANVTDADLIRLIVDMMDQPSQHMIKMSQQLFSTPQSREVDIILNRKVRTQMLFARITQLASVEITTLLYY